MWKTLTVVSMLISVVSCVLAVQAVRSRDEAVRQAVKQYEAQLVQRYAPMIRDILAERGRDNIVVVTPRTLDELFAALDQIAKAVPEAANAADATRDAIEAEVAAAPENRRDAANSLADEDENEAVLNVRGGGGGVAVASDRNAGSLGASSDNEIVLNGHIVFASRDRNEEVGLYELTLPTSTPRPWPVLDWDGSLPVWGPASEFQVAKALFIDEQTDVYLISTDGRPWRRLTDSPTTESSISWSPSGRFLAFQVDGGGENGIRVASRSLRSDRREGALAHKPEDLTILTKDGHMPAWSPVSDQIAFIRYTKAEDLPPDGVPSTQLMLIDSDGTDEMALWTPEVPTAIHNIFWLSDGASLIATILELPGTRAQLANPRKPLQMKCVRIDVGAGTAATIDTPEGFERVLAASPDGKHVLYQAAEGHIPSGGLHALRLSDGHCTSLLDRNYEVIAATWTPRVH